MQIFHCTEDKKQKTAKRLKAAYYLLTNEHIIKIFNILRNVGSAVRIQILMTPYLRVNGNEVSGECKRKSITYNLKRRQNITSA